MSAASADVHLQHLCCVLAGLASEELMTLLGRYHGPMQAALQACVFEGEALDVRLLESRDVACWRTFEQLLGSQWW